MKSMTRLLLVGVLALSVPAAADIRVTLAVNADGTIDSKFPNGDKAAGDPNDAPQWNATPAPVFIENVANSYSLANAADTTDLTEDASDGDGDGLTFANETGCTLPTGITIDNTNDEIDYDGLGSDGTTSSCVFSADDGTASPVNSSAFSITILQESSTDAQLITPWKIAPFQSPRTNSVDVPISINIGNRYTGFPLIGFFSAEMPDGYNGWTSPSTAIWASGTFGRNNKTDAPLRAASELGDPLPGNRNSEVTAFSGSYSVKMDSGSQVRSQIERVADGPTNKGGTYPRMLTHGKLYCTAYAWYETEATLSTSFDLLFQHHNNTIAPATYDGDTFAWYRNGVEHPTITFTRSNVQSNPQFAIYRLDNDSFSIEHRAIGKNFRADTISGHIATPAINQWARFVIVVRFHNDINYDGIAEAPPGGWQGYVGIYYAVGSDPLSLVYEKTGIRMGWLYDNADQGPTSHIGHYGGNNLLGYADNFLQASLDEGMTPEECDPLSFKEGETPNSPMTFTADDLPTGLSINSSTGVISGTPTVTDTFSTVIHVANAIGTFNDPITWTIE